MTAPRSLQGRLLALLLGLALCVWSVAVTITWFDARHELEELLDGHLAQAGALLVVQQIGEIEDGERDVDAPTLHRYAPKVAFQVFHEGRLALRSANAPTLPMIAPREQFQTGFKTVQIDGTDWRMFAAFGAERDIQVYVGEQVATRKEILWAMLRSALWPMLIALPLLALGAWWAIRRSVAPLLTLGKILRDRQPQALDPISVANAPAEMLPMMGALNDLFSRIAALMESERRFTADAAHELRTPIAAIRAQAQVALAEPDRARRAHALDATLQGCDRATRLVEQLLTLSRIETGAVPNLSDVEISAMVREVVAELAPHAIEKQQRLEVDASQSQVVQGNAPLLAALIRNLVDNSIRYSPIGASVKLAVSKRANEVNLEIQDSGPGLSDADIKRLGNRFFRVLGSEQPGSGLGWSIVKRIVSVHGADLKIGRASELGGLKVSISWPTSPANV